jgi:hypothetical protein
MSDNSSARLWCIDKWQGAEVAPDRSFRSTENDFHTFLKNIADVRDRVTILKMYSSEAAGLLPEKAFDLVFIDADHHYDAVRFDIINYAPLVRPGGILCGHDYGPRPMRNGLIQAVNELVTNVRTAGEMLWWTKREPGWLGRREESSREEHVYVVA